MTSPAPASSSGVQIALGPQVLRVTGCGFTPPTPVLPFFYTRVTVSRAGSEWVATAVENGDLEIRFHQLTAAANGAMKIAGTMRGTAVHVSALAGPLPAWEGRVGFGSGSGAAIDGVAFNAGGAFPVAGLDGVGTGTMALIENGGRTCSTTGFAWAIFQ